MLLRHGVDIFTNTGDHFFISQKAASRENKQTEKAANHYSLKGQIKNVSREESRYMIKEGEGLVDNRKDGEVKPNFLQDRRPIFGHHDGSRYSWTKGDFRKRREISTSN